MKPLKEIIPLRFEVGRSYAAVFTSCVLLSLEAVELLQLAIFNCKNFCLGIKVSDYDSGLKAINGEKQYLGRS